MATTGKSLDLAAMKAAQGQTVHAVHRAELTAPADPGGRALREEKAFDHLVRCVWTSTSTRNTWRNT
ncbi:hypothetical protein P73_3585 [Celeribacter indicus]|uniref:Uncharacterized protein n=1 Tax=Celeribacter indicus TaxID=1208324 RepID=A0A0B5E4K8_9RHOB|nr:hypothetical protein P73_3585 [Celeribacter indicus]